MANGTAALGANPKLVAGAGLAIVIIATTFAAVLGNPVVVLVTTYIVAFGAAIILFGDDAFSRATNLIIAIYAAVIAFVCTLSPLPNAAIQGLPLTDRLNYYYIYYVGTSLAGIQENIESGFLFLVNVAQPIMPFEIFLAVISVGVLLSFLGFLRATGQERLIGIVALLFLAYFSFWSGALNITRQFVAAGVCMSAVCLLVGPGSMTTRTRVLLYLALVAVASSMHSSAIIFVLFALAYAVRRFGGALLVGAWIGNIVLFALNFVNASPLLLIPGLSDRLARYDSSQLSDASLAQFQSSGVTTGNRIDWAIVLLSPMLLYSIALISRRRRGLTAGSDDIFVIALLYTVLCVPFYLLSFLTFGDRIAFYAFLVLPVFLMATVTASLGREVRYAALVSVAAICVLQVAIGLYGYTPKLWLTGEL